MKKQSEPITVVIFRIYPAGDVIALFPEEVADSRGNILSYQHIGQHGAADYTGVIQATRPATQEEYEPLRKELHNLGYNFIIRTRRDPRKAVTYGCQ